MPSLVAYTTGPQDQSLATLRFGAPAQALGWQIIWGKEGVGTVYPERVQQADVVLIQRDFPRFFAAYRQVISAARDAGKPVIYELDDLLLAIPDEHPNRRDYEDALGGMAYAIMQADLVVVSTPLLRDVLRPLQPRIAVWPTVLPDLFWSIAPPRPTIPDTPITIGYMGGTSHMPDVEFVAPALRRILETWGSKVQLSFWGCPPPPELQDLPQVQQVHSGVSDYAQFAKTFGATAVADIWLGPLKPGLFNRGKSPIKFWEYSAIGAAGIYSRLEPYEMVVRDGENGLLATTPDEWYTAVDRLLTDPDLRLRLAQNAQQTLRQQGLLSTQLEKWHDMYTAVVPHTHANPPDDLFVQTLLRFSEYIQHRSDERNQEARRFLKQASEQQSHIAALNQQVEDILQSRWWRTMERLNGIRQFFLSPRQHLRRK